MQATNVRRGLVGRDVMTALALLLLVSGMTTASVFIQVGTALASTVAAAVPAVEGALFSALVLLGIYAQAVVLAAVYRVLDSVRSTLRQRAQRAAA